MMRRKMMKKFDNKAKIKDFFLISKTQDFRSFDREAYEYAMKVLGGKDKLVLKDIERILNDIPYDYYYEIRPVENNKYIVVIWKIEEVDDERY
jgi:hypothetical protein